MKRLINKLIYFPNAKGIFVVARINNVDYNYKKIAEFQTELDARNYIKSKEKVGA